MTQTNSLSFRWVREAAITDCEDLQDDLSLLENCTIENDSGDQMLQLLVDRSAGQSRDERVQVEPRAREPDHGEPGRVRVHRTPV